MKDALKLYGKAKKIKLAVKLTAACAVFAMTVYTLIPKDEKIKGVTETGFLKNAERPSQSLRDSLPEGEPRIHL